ncbi:hypothetical protein AAEP93_010048 [Penicillium crustosum]
MPPKRKSTDSAASGAKKPKDSTTNPEVDMETKRALDKRWAPVSVSRNADSEFRLQTRDPVKAYAYVCLGRAPWNTRQNDEFEDEYEEDEESIEQKKKDDAEADNATTLKPASEHPGEKWIFTNAGVEKWITLNLSTTVRNPDNFDMYIHNDFFGYAIMELVENLYVDFDEAAGDWKMQWAICEATALYFQTDAIMPMVGCEDGPTVNLMFIGLATMFLSMLATLERNDLFKPDSEVKNIGAIMGLFIRFMIDVESSGITWDRQYADIEAYAAKHDITIHGLNHLRYNKPRGEMAGLPEATANSDDPWDWKKTLTKLKKNTRGRMGGDSKDITSWTSAERKKVSFDKKDPISRSMMTQIKNGGIMQLGG